MEKTTLLAGLVAIALATGLSTGAAAVQAPGTGPADVATTNDACYSDDPTEQTLWIVTCCFLEDDAGWTECPLDKYFADDWRVHERL